MTKSSGQAAFAFLGLLILVAGCCTGPAWAAERPPTSQAVGPTAGDAAAPPAGGSPPGGAPAAAPTAPPPSEPIADADVPRAAIAAETRIRALRSVAARTRGMQEIESLAPSAFESVDSLMEWLGSRAAAQQTQRALRSLGQEFRIDGAILDGWMQTTGQRLDELGAAITEVGRLEAIWSATKSRLEGNGAKPELVSRAQVVLDAARDVNGRLSQESEDVLLLQSRISSARLDVEESLEAITAQLREERRNLLRIESPPLWKAFGPEAGSAELGGELGTIFDENVRAMKQYAQRAGSAFVVHGVLFFVLLVAFVRFRRRSLDWPHDTTALRACARVVHNPVLGAWLVALLCGPWFHPRAPLVLYELFSILLVVPVLALMRGLVEPSRRGPLYALAALFLAERLWEFSKGGLALERLALLALTGLTAGLILWTGRRAGTDAAADPSRWRRVVQVAMRFALGLLAVSALANLVGNTTLARMLTVTVVRAAYLGVVLYAASLLLRGTAVLLIRSRVARQVRVVDRHGEVIIRRFSQATDLVALTVFVIAVLSVADLFPIVWTLGKSLLTTEWGFGEFRFSLGSVVLFVATVWISVLASRVLRAILEADLYSRVHFPRGVAGTVTFVVRYGIVALGFLLALALAGIPVDRITLVFGALGVGIGFGLQTVVNNFVSGLILMFERPIQIGDTIEVSGLVGRVREIGVRASTIETADGADVIVPNGSLVSGQLINWTLSSRRRRIEIPVGVAFGTDPERALRLLQEAVQGQRGVLADPPPSAVLRGFGHSSLDLSVFFWTGDFERWVVIRSDMAVRVERALREAGIEIPFPRQDVRLVSSAGAAVEAQPAAERSGDGRPLDSAR